MRNNAFEQHGIDHLSPSFLNSWVASPWQAVAKLAGLKPIFGPAASRGNAAEQGLMVALKNKSLSQGIQAAEEYFNEDFGTAIAGHKERASLSNYIENALPLYKELGLPDHYQKKIVYDHPDLPIPFVGYIDFLYEKNRKEIRDLKTQGRNMVSRGPLVANCRQLSIYAFQYPEFDLWLDYVTPKELISHKVQNIKQHQDTVVKIAFGLEKFLSLSSDTQELASILTPDVDDWRFNDGIRKQTGSIWPDIFI